MNGGWILWGSVLLVALTATADCRKRKMSFLGKKQTKYDDMMVRDDPLFSVEPIEPFQTTKIGNCECKCCQPPPAPLLAPQCDHDIIVAVDSSACFRDHHRRMKQFLQRLVNEIHKTKDFQFGVNKTRLAIMQFSNEQNIPIRLDAFSNYEDPPTSKKLKAEINQAVAELGFIGQGAYLDAALNATVQHFNDATARPYQVGGVQKTVIVLTNGKSHPKVTSQDVGYSMGLMRTNRIRVIPVSVTRQCYSYSPDWDEGLCPDINIMKMLGEGSYTDGDDFLPMRASGTVGTVVKEATACPEGPAPLVDFCNTCNCSCELPMGPKGFKGERGFDGINGDKGDKGETGKPGKPGEFGRNGTKGAQGKKGDKGADGLKGKKGDIGPVGGDGVPGFKGEPGENGTIGEVGPRGFKGENGTKGETGEKGDLGQKGSSGVKGIKGSKGSIGMKGQKGVNGTKGEPGVGIKGSAGMKGGKGEQGENGTVGEAGNKGSKGERGLCGKPGPAGSKGEPGLPGIDGADGETGEPGAQGPRGQDGVQGQKGTRGGPGIDGETGPVGPVGPSGPEGLQGPRGPAGQKGADSNVPGPTGPEGPRGPKGERGLAGLPGLHGLQGPPGKQGPRGAVGPKGEEGAIDKESLRPLLVELIRELLPGECVVTECTEYPIDLVFLIDGSDSIDRDDWAEIKNWILKTVDRFNPSERTTKLQVDVVQFSEAVRNEVHQIIQRSSDEIRAAVDAIQLMRSGTKTFTGLRYVNSDVTPNTRDGSYKILITMSDGDTYEDRDQQAIDIARANYDLMLAVGIGSKIHRDKFSDFSKRSEPISVKAFASLSGIIDKIVDESCKNIQEGYNPQPQETSTTVQEPTQSAPAPLQDQASARCMDSRADIAFLISGSTAISSEDFNNLIGFLHGAIKKSFEPANAIGFRFSIIQYSYNTSTALRFEESRDKNVILSVIDNLFYVSGDTRTGNALEEIRYVFEDIRNSKTRQSVPQIAVVFTDGSSEDDVNEPAQALRNAGVNVIAVGVTKYTSHDELTSIASSIELVHSVTSSQKQEYLLRGICKCARGSYVVYDEDGNPIEHVVFEGDDEHITQVNVEEPESSGVDYGNTVGLEEETELP